MRFILCVCFNYTQKLFIHLSFVAAACGTMHKWSDFVSCRGTIVVRRQFNLHSPECGGG